jgi:effector-binding domain-containing protein
MKILKILSFSLLGVISLYAISNLFFSDTFEVEKSIEINTSPTLVFEQINNFKNWEKWDPWLQEDSTMKLEYNAIISGVGATKKWTSENSSSGEMKITESSYIDFIKFEISIENWNSFKGIISLKASENGVIVSWKDSGDLDFLMRVMGPLLNKMIGKDLDKGLKNLKQVCESVPSISSEVFISDPITSYELSIIDSCKISDIQAKLSDMYQEVFTQLAINGVSPSSAPFTQYLSFPKQAGEKDFVVLKAGVFSDIDMEIDPNSRIKSMEVVLEQTIECIHNGAYSTLNKTHQKIEEYCKENDLELKYPGYEFFETDPSLEPDVLKRETRVVYSLR